MFDWNDLKYLIAVAQEGSTLAAGRALGMNQSTVQRRIVELEKQLGRRLVERLPTGYQLTELGLSVLPYAEAVAKTVSEFEHNLESLSRAHIGIIRLTCPEPIAFRLNQAGFLDRFHASNPEFKIEFVLSDQYVDLAAGEADVALRSGDTDDNVLVGRKIADSLWALYASSQYIEKHGQPASVSDLDSHPLIGFEESMSKHRVSTWLKEVAPNATFAARNTSVLGLIYAAKASVGIAPLPMSLGDAESDLVRILGPVPELTRAWRLLAHPDMRQSHRVSALFDFVFKEISALKPILTG
jgi:DNA-binding transcriptional LysR family regulator